jgi:hypothetical protein
MGVSFRGETLSILPSVARRSGACGLIRGFASPPHGGFAFVGKVCRSCRLRVATLMPDQAVSLLATRIEKSSSYGLFEACPATKPMEGVHPLTGALPKNGARLGSAAWIVGVLLLASGCAGLSCQAASITVAKKEERARLEATPRGYTSETGRLEEIRRPEIVRDYWVLGADGTWHRVSSEKYRNAEVGQSLELCR